jgi:hypothetical protein
MQAERPHELRSMSFRRLNADGLYCRNLLVAFAFRPKLENCALPRSQTLAGRTVGLRRAFQITPQDHIPNL